MNQVKKAFIYIFIMYLSILLGLFFLGYSSGVMVDDITKLGTISFKFDKNNLVTFERVIYKVRHQCVMISEKQGLRVFVECTVVNDSEGGCQFNGTYCKGYHPDTYRPMSKIKI